MKSLHSFAAVAGCLVIAAAATVAPASAELVRKDVMVHHGEFGHGCRTVRTVVRGPEGKHVNIRKICR